VPIHMHSQKSWAYDSSGDLRREPRASSRHLRSQELREKRTDVMKQWIRTRQTLSTLEMKAGTRRDKLLQSGEDTRAVDGEIADLITRQVTAMASLLTAYLRITPRAAPRTRPLSVDQLRNELRELRTAFEETDLTFAESLAPINATRDQPSTSRGPSPQQLMAQIRDLRTRLRETWIQDMQQRLHPLPPLLIPALPTESPQPPPAQAPPVSAPDDPSSFLNADSS
jgi:hypothetical protein